MTLDDDVARLLREEVHRLRRPFRDVVNEAIRRGLAAAPPRKGAGRFRVRPHKTTLRPGIDGGALNQLADELEDEAVIEKLRDGR